MSDLFININKLPDGQKEYVSWVDIMGTKNMFIKSDKCPTLYILKLHKAAEKILNNYNDKNFTYYPVIDGFYLVSSDKNLLVDTLKKLFIKLSEEFISEKEQGYKFMIRAGLSYGEVIHGKNINISDDKLGIKTKTKDMLLFGKPIVDATLAENGLPPFAIGIYEDSKTHFDDLAIDGKINWFDDFKQKEDLIDKVITYYAWHEQHKNWVEYPEDKKKQHLFDFIMMLKSS